MPRPARREQPQADELRRRRFEQVYRRYYGEVLAYARRRAPGAAYDIVADTFLVAWRRFDELPDEPLPWLIAVARNTLANHRRATASRTAAAFRLASERAASPELEEPAADERLRSVLARLSERDREALLLVAWDGLSQRQAAAVLGCSPVAFRIRLHRARKRLRAELDALEPPFRPLVPRSPAEGDVR